MKEPAPGHLLDRRYRIIRTLGRGGFGRTYVAEDIRRPGNPKCVVKHLRPVHNNPAVLEDVRRLFLAEAETLERLGNHDQIPRLLAYFEEGQEFYLVQEFVDGHTLSKELQPGQCWSEREVCHLLQDVLGTLEFVHSHGVIHRDIKPSNLIRRHSDYKLVLVDFGIVKQVIAGQFNTTIIAGTPGYMSTEQGRGKPRLNSDIYALGVICIQALTGLNPTKLQDDPESGEIIWQSWVQTSPGFAAIINQMVRYHFKERYQTASEVLRDLEPLIAQQFEGEYPLSTAIAFNPAYSAAVHEEYLDGNAAPRLQPPPTQIIVSPPGKLPSRSLAGKTTEALPLSTQPTENVVAPEKAVPSPAVSPPEPSPLEPPKWASQPAAGETEPTEPMTEQVVPPTQAEAPQNTDISLPSLPSCPTAQQRSTLLGMPSRSWHWVAGAGAVAGAIALLANFGRMPVSSLSPSIPQQSPSSPINASSLECEEVTLTPVPDHAPDYIYDNGTEYYGELKDKLPAGTGVMVFANGDRYDGEFLNGKRHGCGMLTFANGKRYIGQFQDDLFSGQGVWLLKNGDRYVGEFQDGKCNGEGTFIFADGSTRTGFWRNGNLINSNLSCNR